MYRDVFIIGHERVISNGHPVGRVGGKWARPNYALSYLLAARYVLDRATEAKTLNEIALPVAYLQRHAFELALKQIVNCGDTGDRANLVWPQLRRECFSRLAYSGKHAIEDAWEALRFHVHALFAMGCGTSGLAFSFRSGCGLF
jgi:hypothetical protein